MKRTSASHDRTDERKQKQKMKRMAKAPKIRVRLDDILVGLIKAQLASGRHFGDIFLQAVSRRFAVLPVKRNFATSLELRGSDRPFRRIVTLERRGTTADTWTDSGNLLPHLLKVFAFVENFREISCQIISSSDTSKQAQCLRHISESLTAALIEQRRPIKVRLLLLNDHWDPMLNGSDVLVDRASLRSITICFWHERYASVADRYIRAASTCANLRSVSLDYIDFLNSASLDDLSTFLQRLPKLHCLKFGRSYNLPQSCVLRFLASFMSTKCVAFKHLHLTNSQWIDVVLQPSAIGLIGRLRSVIVSDRLFFTTSATAFFSQAFNASICEKVKRICGALPANACISIDFSPTPNATFDRSTTLPTVQTLLRALLQFSRKLRHVVKLIDLGVSKQTLRTAIEALPDDAFVGEKILVENLPKHGWSLSDAAEATIVFTGLVDD